MKRFITLITSVLEKLLYNVHCFLASNNILKDEELLVYFNEILYGEETFIGELTDSSND